VSKDGPDTNTSQWLLLAVITGLALYLTWQMMSPFIRRADLGHRTGDRVLPRPRAGVDPDPEAWLGRDRLAARRDGHRDCALLAVSSAVVTQLSSLASEAPSTVQACRRRRRTSSRTPSSMPS